MPEEKNWNFYPPLRAYADATNPLSLALAPATARELEFTTRDVWKKGTAAEDQEEISAIIKLTRLTVLRRKRKNSKKSPEEGGTGNTKKRKVQRQSEATPSSETLQSETSPEIIDVDEAPPSTQGKGSSDAATPDDGCYDVFEIDGDSEDEGENGTNEMMIGLSSMGCPSLSAWKKRHRIFSLFDQGCAMDETAWFETTPESHALRIARRINGALAIEKSTSQDQIHKVAETQEGAVSAPSQQEDETRPCSVMAACCGVGGDAIALARTVDADTRIVCVDISQEKVDKCRKNAQVYGVEDKMEFVVADLNEYASKKRMEAREQFVDLEAQMPITAGDGTVIQVCKETRRHRFIRRPFSWCVLSPPWGGPEYRSLYSYTLADQKFCDLVKLVQSAMEISDNVCLILPRNQDVNEIVHLAARGSPDHDRFSYLEVEKLTESFDAYPFIVAMYVCRSPVLFLSDREPAHSVTSWEQAKKLAEIDSAKVPVLKVTREPLPVLDVPKKVLAAQKGNSALLTLRKFHNVVFCRFLLSYLEEPPHQIKITEACMQLMGTANFLDCVADTIRINRAGGLRRKDDAQLQRAKGGVFFELIKQKYPDINRLLRKWRKKQIDIRRQKKNLPLGESPSKSDTAKKNGAIIDLDDNSEGLVESPPSPAAVTE